MRVEEITTKKLKDYLKSKGWKIDKFNQNLDTIKLNGFEIIIPNRESLQDYNRRIQDLIISLSTIEEKKIEEIIDSIVDYGYDLFKMRFVDSKTSDGSISLEYANSAIKQIVDIIKYSACSEILPQSRYKTPYKEARELVKNCELAQTEIGSFIIKIRVPLDETYLKDKEKKKEFIEDLGRKTLNRLISGLDDLEKIDLSSDEVFKQTYDEKLNKNVCDAMSRLLVDKDEGLSLEISAKWNTEKELKEKLKSFAKVDSNKYYQKFKKMSVLLEQIPDTKEVIIEGKVQDLKRVDEDVKFEKRLIHIFSTEQKRTINTLLDEQDYKIACNAHRDKKFVKIKGILKQKSGRWVLEDSKDFEVVEKIEKT